MRRVVCTADDPQWLEERHKRVTGSEVAILMDMAEYPKGFSHEEKVARLQWTKKQMTWQEAKSDFETSANMRIINYGRVYEYWEALLFSRLTGAQVWTTHAMLENTQYPGMSVTLDGLVAFDDSTAPDDIPCGLIESPESLSKELSLYSWGELSSQPDFVLESLSAPLTGIGILEVKTAGVWTWKGTKTKSGLKDKLSPYYWAQVQAQLMVTGLPWAVLVAAGDRDRVMHVVWPDKEFHASLAQAVKEFWNG